MNRCPLTLSLAFVVLAFLNGCGGNAPVNKDEHEKHTQQNTGGVSEHSHYPVQVIKGYPPGSYAGLFPKPPGLEPAVAFWRNTYAVWRRSQVVFHDNRHMDVIYEVLTLPGYVAEGLTSEQKSVMNARRDYWKVRLIDLENKLRYQVPLGPSDQQLVAKLESTGKPIGSIVSGASERVRGQRGTRERFKRGLEISSGYDLRFREIFRNAGLPEDLVYLPHVESSFQPAARSSAGAVGMWQFTEGAAKTFMPDGNTLDRRMDPFASAIGASHYLSHAYKKLGNWPSALTAYNHGIGGMKRAQRYMGADFMRIVDYYQGPAFGFASRNYYAQFLAAREIVNNPTVFFAEGVAFQPQGASNEYFAREHAR